MKNLLNQKLGKAFKLLITNLLPLSLFFSFINFSYASNHIHQIAITQIVAHPGLDLSYQGIKQALNANGFKEGKNLKINHFSAQGQQVINMQIAKKIVADSNNELAIGISTPSIQGLITARKNGDLPLIFSSVTNPNILGLNVNSKVTGTIDNPPIEKIWQTIKQISPKITNIGVIYSSSEMNSVELIKELQNNRYGFKIISKAINNTNQIKQATQAIMEDIDLMLVIPDNTVVAGIELLFKTIKSIKPPLITFVVDSTLLEKGALMAIGYSQFDVGYVAGTQAASILKGKDIKELTISSPKKIELLINKTVAEEIRFKFPEEIIRQATVIEGKK